MIPAYNGANYLAKAIQSVLVQDPGPEVMQIEVVDDHSLKEDLRAVAERAGCGRVAYFRQPQNVGLVRNFNTCVRRSMGLWVHILHSDDMVVPGFYKKLQQATTEVGVGAAFCRFYWMNEDDQWLGISDLEAPSEGVLLGWPEKLAVKNRIMAPSIVVARHVYENLGGYDARLSHSADWDMWKRIAVNYPVWHEPTVLACYRSHSSSDTSRLMRTGANIEDARRSIALASGYLPKAVSRRLTQQAYRAHAEYALDLAQGMLYRHDFSGAWAQTRQAVKTAVCARVLVRLVRLFGRFIIVVLRLPIGRLVRVGGSWGDR